MNTMANFQDIFHYAPLFFISIFFSILFLQSGVDKLVDFKGNLKFLSTHFTNTIFKNRVPTSQKVEIVSSQENSNEDIISSRILWLDGLDKGKNKGGNVDSYTRYIYIHGTNEEGLIGEKASHGCIRMSNNDIVNLCKKDLLNTFVYIFN